MIVPPPEAVHARPNHFFKPEKVAFAHEFGCADVCCQESTEGTHGALTGNDEEAEASSPWVNYSPTAVASRVSPAKPPTRRRSVEPQAIASPLPQVASSTSTITGRTPMTDLFRIYNGRESEQEVPVIP